MNVISYLSKAINYNFFEMFFCSAILNSEVFCPTIKIKL